ncbi:nuclear transport factor 2 family protein [Pontimicrobium sp. SW4]|uniref:Nuclear transport factor 2 family protein n=1 Tax=Pontimicrobium sp. SW4 TaxID=3153519 RepID=A0AAU7BVZ5_9FLAO
MKLSYYLLCLVFIIGFSCKENKAVDKKEETLEISIKENETQMKALMQKHLDAVSNKDIETLKSTMSPKGYMRLILPQSEIMEGVDAFIKYHIDWFAVDNGWTFETKILETKVGATLGMAIIEIVYREPDRNGEPYFNRMVVSYVLEKTDGNWYVIKDHASSVEKSTDKTE